MAQNNTTDQLNNAANFAQQCNTFYHSTVAKFNEIKDAATAIQFRSRMAHHRNASIVYMLIFLLVLSGISAFIANWFSVDVTQIKGQTLIDYFPMIQTLVKHFIGLSIAGVLLKITFNQFLVEKGFANFYANRIAVITNFPNLIQGNDIDPQTINAMRIELSKYLYADPPLMNKDSSPDFSIIPIVNIGEKLADSVKKV